MNGRTHRTRAGARAGAAAAAPGARGGIGTFIVKATKTAT